MKTRTTVTLEEKDETKLKEIVESGLAESVSHAVRICIKSFNIKKVKIAA